MSRDSALDELAFMVGLRLMGPVARRKLHISILRDLGDTAPKGMSLETLEDEDRLVRGDREPVTHLDHIILRRAAEAARSPLDPEFWRLRRADLIAAGFTEPEAAEVIAAVRASLGSTLQFDEQEGPTHEALEQAAA